MAAPVGISGWRRDHRSALHEFEDSDSTEIAEVLPDVASRSFRRLGEVGRLNDEAESGVSVDGAKSGERRTRSAR
jgi:hypothetical protein